MLEGNYFSEEVYINFYKVTILFNTIYITEFVIKIIGFGIPSYFKDVHNIIDVFIVSF